MTTQPKSFCTGPFIERDPCTLLTHAAAAHTTGAKNCRRPPEGTAVAGPHHATMEPPASQSISKNLPCSSPGPNGSSKGIKIPLYSTSSSCTGGSITCLLQPTWPPVTFHHTWEGVKRKERRGEGGHCPFWVHYQLPAPSTPQPFLLPNPSYCMPHSPSNRSCQHTSQGHAQSDPVAYAGHTSCRSKILTHKWLSSTQ